MRHGVKKLKFSQGYDSRKMLARQLLKNFFRTGYLVTTEKKAKALKTLIDRIVSKAKERNEANKNQLLKALGDVKLVEKLFSEIGPALKEHTGGFVKLVRQDERISDGSLMVRVSWAYPVVKEVKKEVKKEVEKEVKKEKVAAKK